MAVSLLIAGLLALQPDHGHYTLSLFEGNFVVRGVGQVIRVPINPAPPKPKLVVLYRRDRNYAVWDDRGLTLRAGHYVHSYKLTDIAITPKLFKSDEIHDTIALIHRGVRHKEADALSGSGRIGHNVYFLARWTESSGKPWLEALVKVNLEDPHPTPSLVGRFEGLTTAKQKIDDKMFLAGGRLTAATRRDHDWGVAFFSPTDREFTFRSQGDQLVDVSETGLFTEKTSCGNVYGGRLDWVTGAATRLFEDRPEKGKDNSLYWLDQSLPPVAITRSPYARVIRDCETGAELPASEKAIARRAGSLMLVWSPEDAPTHAYVYDPADWKRLASWVKQ
jgi:hypothetical protein